MSRRARVALKAAVWLVALAPLAGLLYGFWADDLTVNPIEYVTRTLGETALQLLLASLALTPLRLLFGIGWPLTLRRLLGLFAFFYLALHFSTYALLDLGLLYEPGLAWETLLVDIAERPYITVGFTALLLLIPLAATSTRAMQRRLGRKWAKLHRLVYVVAVLGVVHYYWQVKSDLDFAEPLLYAFLLTVLLGVRLRHWLVHAKPAVTAPYQRVEPPQAREKPSH